MNLLLNQQSSQEQKRAVAAAVFEQASDFFFDKINFTSFPFTQVSDAVGKYTSTTNFGGESRLTDTAEGKYLTTEKSSRMRCNFYVENPDKCLGYILSPAVYDSFSSLNTFASIDILRSYAGIKFNAGAVTIAIKEANKSEVTYPTNLSFSGSGATDTVVLETKHSGKTFEVHLNNVYVGSFPADLTGSFTTQQTYLQLLSPAKSINGSGVNIVIENYQFIQDK